VIDIDNITFENPVADGRSHWQDIIHNGECIGALCTIEGSLFHALNERYQCLVPEEESDDLSSWYASEDEGFIFAVFDSLEDFVDYKNSKPNGKKW
jgi:hypothetical protein